MKQLGDPRDVAAILERLDRLSPELRGRWGRLTPAGALVHLADSYRLGLGEREVSAIHQPGRAIMRFVALHTPMPWPHGVPTRPEVDPERAGTRPGEFARDRAGLCELITRFGRDAAELDGRVHPIFGRLTAAEWLRWGWAHADHHLRQFGR